MIGRVVLFWWVREMMTLILILALVVGVVAGLLLLKPASQKAKRPAANGDFRAVSVVFDQQAACPAVRELALKRFLCSEAPMLPLPRSARPKPVPVVSSATRTAAKDPDGPTRRACSSRYSTAWRSARNPVAVARRTSRKRSRLRRKTPPNSIRPTLATASSRKPGSRQVRASRSVIRHCGRTRRASGSRPGSSSASGRAW